MSDDGGNGATAESPDASKNHASKDRNCPYCGQAFTSSSLGRHLDLYIKEKNPKPADGVHNVDEIRKMRSGITRRQPRGSLAARRDTSTPGTPTGSTTTTRKSPEARQPSSIPKDGQYLVDQSPVYPWQQPRWEATGVINDLPAKNGEPPANWDDNADQAARRPSTQQQLQRAPSRIAQKQQLDARQKLTDAMDTARAAELALKELLSSWRAAKQQIDMNSVPFDFDPLALDFPALTLQCLQPPPTLFSSTPIPTSTSWSIQPPAKKQHDALIAYFQEEFKKWRQACAAATTATQEDLTYPPAQNHVPVDLRESIKKAESNAANMEKQVNEHLQSTYVVWEQLPPPRQQELWVLELARSVGRRQKDVEKHKQTQHSLKQEAANLQSQIDQLNRLQQPREFRMMQPATIPFDQAYVSHVLNWGFETGIKGNVGLNMNDRHLDTSTVVQRAIDRWKNVIVASRASGMSAQRALDQPPPASQQNNTSNAAPAPVMNHAASTPTPNPQNQPRAVPAQAQPQQPVQPMPTTNGPSHDARSTTTAATSASASAGNDEGSDEDADAEMEDDDSFAPIAAPPVVAKPIPQQPLQKLAIPRTREHVQQRNNAQFAMNGAGQMPVNQRMNMARPMANMNPGGMQQAQNQQRAQQAIMKNDYVTAVQGMGNGEPMFMDG
ncbi:hypothetical protein BKA67DRAFT_662287 [Truncatella angustata]|uniref:Uncharacterized protein n=1 Tax=Truncatella angustata TaxID=152316 RepID=A0A9P8RK23_9PEZI|nr:uncharacterized protein BKA67DRAFT_662287 [Truncatella angustata]KAH6647501.1 hypothetical protein BKA67DRAFT_662287 [Truncatella angustata]